MGLWWSYVRVRNTGVAEAVSFATAEATEVCVATFSGYERGWIFRTGDARGARRLDDVLVGYCYAVRGAGVTDDAAAFSTVVLAFFFKKKTNGSKIWLGGTNLQ